ncbi:MAG: tetratricopeptide repeat protein [Verrucomicrobiaceae bacterium]
MFGLVRLLVLVALVGGGAWGEVRDGLWNGKPLSEEVVMEGVRTGDAEALAEWAYWARVGWGGVGPDEGAVFFAAARSAAMGSAYGKAILSRCYLVGQGVGKDEVRGLALARESAEAGHPLGMKNLANCYLAGAGGLEADFEKGLALTEEAAGLGCVVARENLMKAHFYGKWGMKVDQAEGVRRAVEIVRDGQGIEAAFLIARYHRDNRRDRRLTEEVLMQVWRRIERSSDAGGVEAMARMGRYLCETERDEEGVPLILKAAGKPHHFASAIAFDYASGGTFSRGAGTVGEYATVYRFARDAYESGNEHENILASLAESFFHQWGEGEPSAVKAEPFVRKLAVKKGRRADEMLGRLYVLPGANPFRDQARGVAHLVLGVRRNSGIVDALIEAHLTGPEEERDLVRGYALAARQGFLRGLSVARRKEMEALGEAAKEKMTPEEITEAEGLMRRNFPLAEEFQKEAAKFLERYAESEDGTVKP